MLIDWFKFAPALLLLLTPIAVFNGKKIRYRELSRSWEQHWRPTLTHGHHVIDLLRALLGAWLLTEALTRVPGARGLAAQTVLLTQAAVLLTATLVQTVVCREPDALHAPFAFVAGAALGFLPPLIASFALVSALVIALGSHAPAAFFPMFALSIGAVGFLFTGKKTILVLVTTGCMALLPWLFSLLFNRTLVVPYRSRHTGTTLPPHR